MKKRWDRAVKPRRALLALRCLGPLADGATVVIVNWNSLDFLRVACEAVQRFSPAGTRLLVVDNGSSDGSIQWLRQAEIPCLAVGANIGHSAALDLGFTSVRTRTACALDVDAFPISPDWLRALETALDDGAAVAGAHGGYVLDRLMPSWDGSQPVRDFVHPCCLAMRLRRYAWRGHSFRRVIVNGRIIKDPAEVISDRERGRLAYLEPTSRIGPGSLGTVFGGVVYHNFYSTRHAKEGGNMIDGVTADEAKHAWSRAVSMYLSSGSRT